MKLRRQSDRAEYLRRCDTTRCTVMMIAMLAWSVWTLVGMVG